MRFHMTDKYNYKEFKIPMPFGASLIPFPTLVEGELILFGPWSPQAWRHQTQLKKKVWNSTFSKVRLPNLPSTAGLHRVSRT